MAKDTRYDFPVISEGTGQRVGPSLSEAKFGDTVLEEEPVYDDTGGDWRNGEWGEQVGTVTLSHHPTTVKGRILVHATFRFNDDEIVEFAGLVPGNGSWKGKGRLGYLGGSGK
ncbi:MAG TPA: hypothetical protein VHH92_01565, partial [Actinomycetota bacterium]|nr:hypothetical protein [Actinomycetota bacterium]